MRASERKIKQDEFLEALADCCSIRKACKKVGIARKTVYNWQASDANFAERFQEATEDANDLIDDEIFRRAVDGYEEQPVVSMGKVILDDNGKPYMIRKYSDTLMQMLAKSRMPKYREKQQIEMSGPNGTPIQQQTLTLDPRSMTLEQLDTLKKLAQEMKEGKSS